MALEIIGKLIEKGNVIDVNERFKKREFVLDITEEVNGTAYPNFAKMQLVQNRCELLDSYREGDVVKVSFNVRGNKWERDGKVNYITNLDAWRIERANMGEQNAYSAPPAPQAAPQTGHSGNFNTGNTSFGNPNTGNDMGMADDLPF